MTRHFLKSPRRFQCAAQFKNHWSRNVSLLSSSGSCLPIQNTTCFFSPELSVLASFCSRAVFQWLRHPQDFATVVPPARMLVLAALHFVNSLASFRPSAKIPPLLRARLWPFRLKSCSTSFSPSGLSLWKHVWQPWLYISWCVCCCSYPTVMGAQTMWFFTTISPVPGRVHGLINHAWIKEWGRMNELQGFKWLILSPLIVFNIWTPVFQAQVHWCFPIQSNWLFLLSRYSHVFKPTRLEETYCS